MAYLFPSRFHTRAWHMPTAQRAQRSAGSPARRWPGLHFWLPLPPVLAALAEEIAVWLRGLYLALLFTPVMLTAPAVFWLGLGADAGRAAWMDLLLWTIEHAGPAFIKWAQWSSSRPDLFPRDLCSRFERLQSGAPSHDGALSLAVVGEALAVHAGGAPLFDAFDAAPVASGSIAQVHRAWLSPQGAALTGCARGTLVAVKVRHPGVSSTMQRDFVLMQRAAATAGLLPGVADLRLDESIRQFGGPLKEQLDLSVEARHLTRFNHNFRRWSDVRFPRPLYPLVAPDVLVETFEEGNLISSYVSRPEPCSRTGGFLAETGLNLYLQMLLTDNFCHADLHPGNILVRERTPGSSGGLGALLRPLLQHAGWEARPHMVLLDAGMTAELKPADQRNIVDFFRALTRQDGERLGHSILALSERHTCRNPDLFVADMARMFEDLDPEYIRKNTTEVFMEMIEALRQHSVTLKSTVSTIVVTALVLEGWSNKLDPELHILDTMRDLLNCEWPDRISRVVDKMMTSGSVVVSHHH